LVATSRQHTSVILFGTEMRYLYRTLI